MKPYLAVLFVLLAMINVALGAVGDVNYEGTSSLQSGQSYLSGTSGQSSGLHSSALQTATGAIVPYSGQSDPARGGMQWSQYNQPTGGLPAAQSTDATPYSAPQISGPYQEQMTAEALNLQVPRADSFSPDQNLNFVSATPPGGLTGSAPATMQSAVAGTGNWYYPGSSYSANRLYVQTYSGFGTVGGCNYGGYLPIWANINSPGNFFVYEWYPGQYTPTARWWGWSGMGFKKGWFFGDMPGWHILCYSCGYWSNYIYIYVYPMANAASTGMVPLPAGAPVPPDPASEKIMLPDYNLYQPSAIQTGYPSQGSSYQGYGAFAGVPVRASYPASAGASAKATATCTTCTSSTVVASGVSGSCPYPGGCASGDGSLIVPPGYAPQSYSAVFPAPSVCKCNEYYVQNCPGKLSTVAGVYCGEWLTLWSKVSRPGIYWSFEWTAYQDYRGLYSSPDVRNFGRKCTGWHQTWFEGNNPGWHILSFYCNDWSNYVYIYVWPED
ncbi:Uncharacterised protein [uncultured archaeon]|nr:Uncharacterised protein [uncultured archaeon]